MQDEWEAGLASTSRLTPSSTPSSSAPSTTMDQSASVPDAYCFELLSMVLALSGSRVGRSYVAQQDGLLLDLVSLLHTGTPRIQRQVNRGQSWVVAGGMNAPPPLKYCSNSYDGSITH